MSKYAAKVQKEIYVSGPKIYRKQLQPILNSSVNDFNMCALHQSPFITDIFLSGEVLTLFLSPSMSSL